METLILVVHILVALSVVGLVLLQQGKGAEAGASFGGGASQTLFGSAGSANFLSRTTKWLSVIFFTTSFALAYLAKQQAERVSGLDILQHIEQQAKKTEKPLATDLPTVEEYGSGDAEVPDIGGAKTSSQVIPKSNFEPKQADSESQKDQAQSGG